MKKMNKIEMMNANGGATLPVFCRSIETGVWHQISTCQAAGQPTGHFESRWYGTVWVH